MDATPTDFLAHHDESSSSLAPKWTALHAAAEVVASLAGIDAGRAQDLPAAVEQVGGWRLDLIRQGIDDIVAIMEPGLSALLKVHGQGGDPRPAAAALWQEFDRARQPLLALARAAEEIA